MNPPNIRHVETCFNCNNSMIRTERPGSFCKKYPIQSIYVDMVCDDYEEEEVED